MLGWIGEDTYADLLIVGRIRNRFAHTIEAKDFSDQKISAWLTNMNVYKLLPDLRAQGEERVKANPSVTNTVFIDIINDAINDGQMGFRFCVDMMIGHLDKCGANMERNLANLSGNWLTADDQDEQTPSP